MKHSSKALSIFLTLALILSVFSITVSAADFTSENLSENLLGVGDMSDIYTDNLSWEVKNNTLYITGEGFMKTYDMLNYTPWYSYRDSIKSVVVAEGVTTIGDYAFYDLYELESVTLPSTITSIGSYAFGLCYALKNVTIPESVSAIMHGTFYYCISLKNITIHNSIDAIAYNAFYACESLESVLIPETVTFIHDTAFDNCTSLKEIYGVKDSAAETYATNKGIPFVDLGSDYGKYFGFDMSATLNEKDSSIIDVALTIKNIKEELYGIEFVLNFDSSLVEGVVQESLEAMDVFMTKVPMYTMEKEGTVSILPRYEQICTYNPENSCYQIRLMDLIKYPFAELGQTFSGLKKDGEIVITVQFRLLKEVSDVEVAFSTADTYGTTVVGLNRVPGSNTSASCKIEAVAKPEGEFYMDDETNTMPYVAEKTTVSELVSALAEYGINATVTDANGNVAEETAYVGTGFIVKTATGKEYTVIVKGDVDGSGVINTTDYLRIKIALLGDFTLEDVYFLAADTDGSGSLNTTDYLQIKSYFIGILDLYA